MMSNAPTLEMSVPEFDFCELETSRREGDCELARRIDTLTYRQVRDLNIAQDANRVILHGRAKSYYIKQLATHAVLDLLPGVAVENSICVIR